MEKFEILLYTTPEGEKSIEVFFEQETFWLSQKKKAASAVVNHLILLPPTEPNDIIKPETNAKLLSECFYKYTAYAKPKSINKLESRIHKWRRPRILAFRALIECIGDKFLDAITRDDISRFRDWLLECMEAQEIVTATANKNFNLIITPVCRGLTNRPVGSFMRLRKSERG